MSYIINLLISLYAISVWLAGNLSVGANLVWVVVILLC